jgi:four helix bundle protein
MTGAGSWEPGAGKGAAVTSPERSSHPHERLDAWRQAIALVKDVYAATASFPGAEQFGLVAQMRRAAVSVPANIAEGAGRGYPGEMARFYSIARGSLSELDTLFVVARELGYLEQTTGEDLRGRIARVNLLINGMIRYQQGRCTEAETEWL